MRRDDDIVTEPRSMPSPILRPLSYDLIPSFLFCFQALQADAQQSRKERKESNRKKRVAHKRLHRMEQKLRPVLVSDPVSQQIVEDVEDSGDEKHQEWAIRYRQRNKGMKGEFEQHVRCLMATGSTARQAQDQLLLDANYMLPACDATTFCSSLPKLRWFQYQREGLGIESYLYGFIRLAAASRVIQVLSCCSLGFLFFCLFFLVVWLSCCLVWLGLRFGFLLDDCFPA